MYQQPTTSSNSFFDHQTNINSHLQQQVQSMLHKESNLKRSHNIKSNFVKKHVKFAKSSKITTAKAPQKKFKKVFTKDNKAVESMEAAAAMQQPLYYYYYYPEETTAVSDEQQYFYANNNNYYYYAIDGTSDVNYPPEFFIQPSTGNNENYMR